MGKVPLDLFRKIHLFSSLSDGEIEEIVGKITVRKFHRNEVILAEEDTNHFMYIVLSGKVKVVRATDEGKEMILAIHQAGESFGELSIIDGKTSPATVVALGETIAVIISQKEFFAILHGQGKVLINLLRIFCSRLRESWEKVQMLNLKNASDRVKLLFSRLSDTCGLASDNGTTLTMKFTHQDIADMTGLTRETVTRVLDKFQRDGGIKVLSNRHIHLNPGFFDADLKLDID